MTGLIGWWPLHETSGSTAHDLSGNGNNGALNGGITQGVAGKSGLTSYSLDGNDDEILIGPSSDFDISGKDPVSVCVWFKLNSPPSGNWIATFRDNDESSIDKLIRTNNDGTVEWYTFNEGVGSEEIYSNTTINENEWIFAVGIFDGSNNLLYLNGELETLGKANETQPHSNPRFQVSDESNPADASINEVRVYDRALTPKEVQKLYKQGSGDYARPLNDQNSSSAVSRWAFDSDLTDSWGNNDGASNVSAGYDSGIRNEAKVFDGSDEYVDVSNTGVSSPVTVSSWIYPRSSGGNGYGRIFDQEDDFDLALGDSSGYTILWEINNNNYWYGNDTLPKNEWHHLVASINTDGTGKVFVNGSLLDKKNSETVTASSNTARIGDMVSGGRKFDGFIDDLRIYSKALSASEVFELYRWGTRGIDMRKKLVNKKGGA